MRTYGLYEGGELVYKGTANQISEKYYMDKNALYNAYHHNYLFLNKYNVTIMSNKPEPHEARMTQFEKNIEYVIKHLKLYGNTTLPKIKTSELKKYIDAIKEKGYDVDVKGYNERTGTQITLEGSKLNKTKYDINYIVEIKK